MDTILSFQMVEPTNVGPNNQQKVLPLIEENWIFEAYQSLIPSDWNIWRTQLLTTRNGHGHFVGVTHIRT